MTFPLLRPLRRLALAAAATVLAQAALAQGVAQVSGAWVRGTVAQQKATGAFLQITAPQGGRLVGVASPVAGVAEIHEMRMDGSVMRMAAVPALELPAGKAVELRPGGYHVMLMELKQPLKEGDTVPLTLTVESGGRRETLSLQVPVKALGTSAAGAAQGADKDGHAHHGHSH